MSAAKNRKAFDRLQAQMQGTVRPAAVNAAALTQALGLELSDELKALLDEG